MSGLFFGANVDGGTFPAVIWGDYMGRIKGDFCEDFEPPSTPFVSTPFYGKYSKSGGSLTGADDPDVDPVESAVPDPETGEPTEEEPADETAPEPADEGFDPEQYEAEPQPAPAPAPEDGGAAAPEAPG